jgi:DNA polymerase elongation subunit (family B)
MSHFCILDLTMMSVDKFAMFDSLSGSCYVLLYAEDGSDDSNRTIQQFISECKKRIGVDVEHSQTFAKAAIMKKKHYFGVTNGAEIKVVGMEGKKNDRPIWINKVFDQFLEDFKADRDPSVNLQAAINDLEQGRVDPELLKIKVKLAKNPADYAVNNPNKKIGMLLGAKACDVIWYFKTDSKKGGVTINPEEICITKYKEMLMSTVKHALEILGYKTERIFNSNIGTTRGWEII